MQFASNKLLEQICELLPDIDPDWKKICSDEHKPLVKGLQWPQIISRMAEWYLSDALDAIRDGLNADIVTPLYPIEGPNFKIHDDARGQHNLYHRIRDDMTKAQMSQAHSKIGELHDFRFIDKLGVAFEIKIGSNDEHRANKLMAQHAQTSLTVLSDIYGTVGYCAVLNNLNNSEHQKSVLMMGGKLVKFGIGKEQFERDSRAAAEKYGFIQ